VSQFAPQNYSVLLKKGQFIKTLGKGGYGKIDLYKFGDDKFVVKKFHYSKFKNAIWYLKKMLSIHSSNISPDEHIRNTMLHEYSIGKMLDTPCIRKTLSIDIKSKYLFLEYFQGLDLYDFLTKNKLSFKENIKIFKSIVEAIHYLHSNFIAHLDIKLENIMIDPNTHNICIIDLGKAFVWKKDNQNYKLMNIVSSFEYMAPEEFDSNCQDLYPDKIDIWSLGLLLYCFVYNALPWSSAVSTDNNFCSHVRFLQIEQLSPLLFSKLKEESNHINDQLTYLFKNTLCIDPSKRINTQEILNILNLHFL
jgi:serine/threonine protein kinase